MKKAILAIAAAAIVAAGTMTAPKPAEARCYGCGVGAGVIGGLAAGAIIGGAIANQNAYGYPRAYYPVAGYEPYGYGAPPPYAAPADTGLAVRYATAMATLSAGAARAFSARNKRAASFSFRARRRASAAGFRFG